MTEETVNHPRHYASHPSGVECVQLAEMLSFNAGNALKYIWRAGLKHDRDEDLKKALWYLRREEERLTSRAVGDGSVFLAPRCIMAFCNMAHQVKTAELGETVLRRVLSVFINRAIKTAQMARRGTEELDLPILLELELVVEAGLSQSRGG